MSGILPDAAGAPTGTPLSDPALVEMISEDPVLRSTKLIAEAWDCDGLNQACPCLVFEQELNVLLPLWNGARKENCLQCRKHSCDCLRHCYQTRYASAACAA